MEHTLLKKPIIIAGIPIHALSMNELLDICENTIDKKQQIALGVLNVAKLVNAQKDLELRKSILNDDIIVADGQGVVLLSRLMGKPLPERVAGIDIMTRLLERAHKKHYRVFLLGAKESIVEKVVSIVQKKYSGVVIAGYRDGYFDLDKDGETIAQQIKESTPDIIFVAMTSPKKEIFLDRWKKTMNISVCHGVGGSFDVVAGYVKRAPIWMQRYGLEWLYRVIQEPRRMWKRYLITNAKFILLVCREVLKMVKDKISR